jgi:hypothetical protein
MTGRQNSFLAVIALLMSVAVSPAFAQNTPQAAQCGDWPRIEATDPAYSDAMTLARVLAEDGVSVLCIGPSTMNGTFEGEVGAAVYKTSGGVFEALFLPQSQTFDELQIRERRDGAFYLYSFEGKPKRSNPDPMTASRPFHFLKNLNRLIVSRDKELVARLEAILERH